MELSYNNKSFEVVKNNGHFIVRNKKTGLISTLKVRQGQDVKKLSLSIGKQKMTVIKDLEDSFEVLNNSDYFGIDVGNNQKEEYAKGLSYIITESKGGK